MEEGDINMISIISVMAVYLKGRIILILLTKNTSTYMKVKSNNIEHWKTIMINLSIDYFK
jgi:hypothetical protein